MLTVDKRKAKSIAKYFIDLNNAVLKIHQALHKGGLAVFVIGNTKYKGINVDNAEYLHDCLIDKNFKIVEVSKRSINLKILTPYRDKKGRFSKDSSHEKVYSHEYVIVGEK